MSPELSRLLGYIVARSKVYEDHIIFTQDRMDLDIHQDIRGLLFSLFQWDDRKDEEGGKTIEVTSSHINQFFRACGIPFPGGDHLRTVPWCVLKGTREIIVQFLKGLFERSSNILKGTIEFVSFSKQLVQEVRFLLLQLGIVTSLDSGPGKRYTFWKLTMSGENLRRFTSQIGFVSKRKIEALAKFVPDGVHLGCEDDDPIPYVQDLFTRVREAMRETTAGDKEKQQVEWEFQRLVKKTPANKASLNYNFLRQLLALSERLGVGDNPAVAELSKLLETNYYYDKIVKVVDTGDKPIMDLEIDHPSHTFISDGFVSHNTIEVLGALCYLWEGKEPNNRVIIVTPKSALRQWIAEFQRFTTGVKAYLVTGSFEQRVATYRAWAKYSGPEKPVLLLNYALLIRDWDYGSVLPTRPDGKPDPKGVASPGLLDRITKDIPNLVTVFDESQAFKSTTTKTWQTCKFLSDRSYRCYGLTATLLKNNLMEGYSIYKVIFSRVFTTKSKFMEDFCVTRKQAIRGGRQIPIVTGYKNLAQFRARIDPFFLGRPKHEVSDELPTLITKEVLCELSPIEDQKYDEALSGVLELGNGDVKDYEEHKAFVSLLYCQQVVNSLHLLKFDEKDGIGLSAKEEALTELLTEELEDEKVIVYTRFESHVARLQAVLKEAKVKSVRLTGKDKDEARRQAQNAFQDLSSDIRVIIITAAGSEAINLQSAGALIFYDAPWSWGDYVQIIGRMVRIGSPHQHVVVYHLIAERPEERPKKRRTIDHHTLALLRGKKDLIDKVLGESAVGALDFGKGDSFVRNLVHELRNKNDDDDLDGLVLP